MIAFHENPAIKRKYLDRVRAHAKADELIHGVYWEDGKGCAVGCTIHSGHHGAYETELGIPLALAHLEDRIFEGLGNGRAKSWPAQFLSAIRVGTDLSGVLPRFLLALQERRYAALDARGREMVGPAIQGVIVVLLAWAETGSANASAAVVAAESAAASAASAAASAASAAWSAAASAASAARSAESAARSAAVVAAESAAWSAAVVAAASAESAARSAEYEWQAETLLALLRSAPQPSSGGQ